MRNLDYYVYALMDPRLVKPRNVLEISFSHTVRYIGKGIKGRIKVSAYSEGSYLNTPKAKWLRRLDKKGLKPLIMFVKQNLSEQDAFATERLFIETLGRKINDTGILFNASTGGEGGARVITKQEVRDYDALLKGHSFKRIGPFDGYTTYIDHKCPEHGTVSTAPSHAKKRLRLGTPLCPKCGIVARGPVQSEVKHKKFSTKYVAWFIENQGVKGYTFIGPYTDAVTNSLHACPKHGEFYTRPMQAKSKVEHGLTCCTKCNISAKDPAIRVGKIAEGKRLKYLRLLRATYPDKSYALLKIKGTFSTVASYVHRCPKHGRFNASPAAVRSRILKGITPCPMCNIEVRNINNGLR